MHYEFNLGSSAKGPKRLSHHFCHDPLAWITVVHSALQADSDRAQGDTHRTACNEPL